jgi:DNA-binding protein HU-beta
MIKADLVKKMAAQADVTQVAAAAVLNALVGIIGQELTTNGRQEIAGLGTFKLTTRAARTGRNPKTGEKVQVPAKNRVLFKAAPALLASTFYGPPGNPAA